MEFVAREDNLGITKEAYIVESSYLDPQYFWAFNNSRFYESNCG